MDFTRGEILYHTQFFYLDPYGKPFGHSCDKLLLVINRNHTHPDDIILIPCKTKTPKDPAYKYWCDDQYDVFYFPSKIGFYDAQTVVQLDLINIYPCGEIEDNIKKNIIDRPLDESGQPRKKLTDEELRRIFKCLRKIKNDIDKDIWELIS